MIKPRDIRDIPFPESLSIIIDNIEHCKKHVWVYREIKQSLLSFKYQGKNMRWVCRYCGRDQRELHEMERQLHAEYLANKYPGSLPDVRIL